MNLIGEKNLFAIEWSIDSYHQPYWYGHLQFWIGNFPVGNFNEISTLTVSISYLQELINNRSKRIICDSNHMSKEQLFDAVYESFFDSNTSIPFDRKLPSQLRDIFWLDEVGEYSFRDKVGIILVEEPELKRQRFIWKTFKTNEIREFFVPIGTFERVAIDFITDLKNNFKQP